MFSSNVVNINQNEIIKEGWLQKESRFRKVWRERWCVLTPNYFFTFENEKIYVNPTESLEIKKIKTVKTDETKKGNYFVYYIIYFRKLK